MFDDDDDDDDKRTVYHNTIAITFSGIRRHFSYFLSKNKSMSSYRKPWRSPFRRSSTDSDCRKLLIALGGLACGPLLKSFEQF